MKRAKTNKGFTIVELLIVVVVIAILAAITIVAYNGIQNRAQAARADSDIATYNKAILSAREARGTSLRYITGSNCSVCVCVNSTYNPTAVEPRELPKTNGCWVHYYNNLDLIGAAAGMDLSGLKKGDPRGNPYMLDENEDETCSPDILLMFNGSGVNRSTVLTIPRLKEAC